MLFQHCTQRNPLKLKQLGVPYYALVGLIDAFLFRQYINLQVTIHIKVPWTIVLGHASWKKI